MKNSFDISGFVDVRTEEAIIADLVERVRLRCKESRLTHKALADRSGVSYGSVKRFFSTGDIAFASLVKIARALDCLGGFDGLFAKKNYADMRGWDR